MLKTALLHIERSCQHLKDFMARAKRHYIPGQVWHLTHRCHKREFLLKFVQDRRRWVQWLYQARKRYGLTILNYAVTCNHIHLLVLDGERRDIIPQSIQLIAGRTAQEYNQRKKRRGAFWEDRYHATAIDSDEYLMRCLIYIDLNMVRTGVVSHPAEWPFCGYNEIQNPRRKTILIDYQKLATLGGFSSYNEFKDAHHDMVEGSLSGGKKDRQAMWTESIALGSKDFVKSTKDKLGLRAKGREVIATDGLFELKEKESSYMANFEIIIPPSSSSKDISIFWFR